MTFISSLFDSGALALAAASFCLCAFIFRKDIKAGRLMRQHQRKAIKDRLPVYQAIFRAAHVDLKAPDYAVSEQRDLPPENWPADRCWHGNGNSNGN